MHNEIKEEEIIAGQRLKEDFREGVETVSRTLQVEWN